MTHYPSIVSTGGIDGRSPLQRLLASPILSSLFLAYDHRLTLDGSGRVPSWTSAKGANTFTQATGGTRPLLRANQINGRPALYFEQARADVMQLTTRPTTSGDFGMTLIYRPALSATSMGLLVSLTDASNNIRFQQISSGMDTAGTIGATARSYVAVEDAWNCITLGKDSSTFGISHNGNRSARVAHANQTGTAAFNLGAGTGSFEGDVALVAFWSGDPLASANVASFAALSDWVNANYGLTV